MLDATAVYIAEEDKVEQWVKQNCVFAPDFNTELLKLYGDYQQWCIEHREAQLRRGEWKRSLIRAAKPNVLTEGENSYTRRASLLGIGIRDV